jgi:hypothetical protein
VAQVAGRKAWRRSRDARRGRVAARFAWRCAGREGSRFPVGCVDLQMCQGVRGRGGERRTLGCAGTRCTDGHTLDRKGVAGGGDHPRCTDGYTPAGGSGVREA